MAKLKRICKNCGIEFSFYPYQASHRKFCTHKCYWLYQIGRPGHPMSEETKKKCSGTWFKKGHKSLLPGGHHSKETIEKISEMRKGSNNPAWKGGCKIFVGEGYAKISMQNHPFCDSKGYVLEHRLVMEKHLGRFLKPEEVVHHIDGNIRNNDVKNLKLFSSHGNHVAFHHKLRRSS